MSDILYEQERRSVLSILKAPPKTTKVRQVLRLVMSMVQAGTALCVPGNHDIKLMHKLRGKDVQITHGLADSLQQLDKESPEGRLVVAHAGMKEEVQGRSSGKVRDFALYG